MGCERSPCITQMARFACTLLVLYLMGRMLVIVNARCCISEAAFARLGCQSRR